MRGANRIREAVAGAVVTAGVLVLAAVPAGASFDATTSAAQAVSTVVLDDPSWVDAVETACVPQAGPEVTVSWSASGTGHDGFAVLRSDDGGVTFSTLASVPADTTSYVDAAPAWATSYLYAVTATRAGWASPGAVTAAVTTSSKGCRPAP